MIIFSIIYVIALVICTIAFLSTQYPDNGLVKGTVVNGVPNYYRYFLIIAGVVPIVNVIMAVYVIWCTEIVD